MNLQRLTTLFGLMAWLIPTSPALAWGSIGHAIVADIAEAHLTPSARKNISELIRLRAAEHLDQLSSWADDIRRERQSTAPWHYVDIPFDAATYDAARDCPESNCIVAKTAYFEKAMTDEGTNPGDRIEALSFLVHFVGDIHQPMHAINRGDKGGNAVKLTYFDTKTNLHAIWDDGILKRALGISEGPGHQFDRDAVRAIAIKLDQGVAAADRTAWAPRGLTNSFGETVAQWANESHQLAVNAYQYVPDARTGDRSSEYQNSQWPVVQQQLEKAGLRLAETLNELFH